MCGVWGVGKKNETKNETGSEKQARRGGNVANQPAEYEAGRIIEKREVH